MSVFLLTHLCIGYFQAKCKPGEYSIAKMQILKLVPE